MHQFTTWKQYIDHMERGLCINKDTIGELVATVAKVHKLDLRDGTLHMQDNISIHAKACLESNRPSHDHVGAALQQTGSFVVHVRTIEGMSCSG